MFIMNRRQSNEAWRKASRVPEPSADVRRPCSKSSRRTWMLQRSMSQCAEAGKSSRRQSSCDHGGKRDKQQLPAVHKFPLSSHQPEKENQYFTVANSKQLRLASSLAVIKRPYWINHTRIIVDIYFYYDTFTVQTLKLCGKTLIWSIKRLLPTQFYARGACLRATSK